MAKRADGFSFPVELGRRLRELRLRAGLTQAEVSGLMGRGGRVSKSQVSLLENGRIAGPGLALIADYLRAVRGRFSEIAGILDRYTTQPTIIEQQGTETVERVVKGLPPKVAKRVLNYDIKTRVRRRFEPKPPEPVDERFERVRRLAAKWLQQQALEDLLHALLDRAGAKRGSPERKALADHGRKVWGILNRTRKRGRDRREKLVTEKRDWLVRQGVAELLVRQVEEAVGALHARLETDGELDLLPGAEEAKRLRLLGKGRVVRTDEQRGGDEFRARFIAWEAARGEFNKRVRARAEELARAAGLNSSEVVHHLNAVLPFINACFAHEPGSDALARAADAVEQRFSGEGCDAAVIRGIRELVFREWAAARAGFPPNPRG